MRLELTALLLLNCATAFPRLELKELPTAEQHPGAKVVVLLDEIEAQFDGSGRDDQPGVTVTTRRRLKVLRAGELPPVRAEYSRSFSTIERIRGRIVLPDGSEKPLDISKQWDFPASGGSVLFRDYRVVQVPVPPVPVGGVFEFEIVEHHDDVRPYVVSHAFGDTSPVEVDRVVLTAPKGWSVDWRLQAFDGVQLEPTITTTADRTTWTWERTKLAALSTESDGPPLWAKSSLLAARLESWAVGSKQGKAHATPEALSAWLAAEYAKHATVTRELTETVREVLAHVDPTPEAKARALYEFACTRVQYCAIEIGYGGWIPHDAKAVHETRYGDCKDKATYLHTLLAIAGVPSYPTLIYAHSGSPLPFALPSLGANFNHAILAVHLPGGTTWVDPTQRVVPFGDLAPSDSDATVLELRPDGAPLARTPDSEASQNVETQRYALMVRSDGSASGTFDLEATSARALAFKERALLGTGQLKNWLRERLWLTNPTLDDERLSATPFARTVHLEGRTSTRHALALAADGTALLSARMLLDAPMLPADAARASDLVRRMNDTRIAEVSLTLPAGSTVSTSQPVVIESPLVGQYSLRWSQSQGVVTLRREFVRHRRVIPRVNLGDYNAFAARVLEAEAQPLVLSLPKVTP